MGKPLPRTSEEITAIYSRNVRMIYRVCFTYMKNPHDTEDAVHDTFMKLITSNKAFESEEHEKAWLLRVSINICKNMLRHWRRRVESLEALVQRGGTVPARWGQSPFGDRPQPTGTVPMFDETLDAICALPDKYKTVILLYYYEGYSSAEIARMLGKPQSTITNHMSEARKMLKKVL